MWVRIAVERHRWSECRWNLAAYWPCRLSLSPFGLHVESKLSPHPILEEALELSLLVKKREPATCCRPRLSLYNLLMTEEKKAEDHPSEESSNDGILVEQIGVWRYSRMKETVKEALRPQRQWQEILTVFNIYTRLLREIYSISPGLLFLYLCSKVWEGIQSSVLAYLSGRLLWLVSLPHIPGSFRRSLLFRKIEMGITEGKMNKAAISMAIVARLSCVVFVTVLQMWRCVRTFSAVAAGWYDNTWIVLKLFQISVHVCWNTITRCSCVVCSPLSHFIFCRSNTHNANSTSEPRSSYCCRYDTLLLLSLFYGRSHPK